jgi:hypothetical protein
MRGGAAAPAKPGSEDRTMRRLLLVQGLVALSGSLASQLEELAARLDAI